MVFKPDALIEELKRTIASLLERWRGTHRENERLWQDNEQLREHGSSTLVADEG